MAMPMAMPLRDSLLKKSTERENTNITLSNVSKMALRKKTHWGLSVNDVTIWGREEVSRKVTNHDGGRVGVNQQLNDVISERVIFLGKN